MDSIKTDKITLKKFGFLMAGFFFFISLVIFIKHRQISLPTIVIALLFAGMAIFIPALLKYFYIVWLKLAYLLSWLNTRLLLCVIFYCIFTPIGLFMRLFRIDLLERKFDNASGSYWKTKADKRILPNDYHRQS
jgi:hypothetical protein